MGRIRGQFNENGWTLEVVEEVKLEPKEAAERPINTLYESSVHAEFSILNPYTKQKSD